MILETLCMPEAALWRVCRFRVAEREYTTRLKLRLSASYSSVTSGSLCGLALDFRGHQSAACAVVGGLGKEGGGGPRGVFGSSGVPRGWWWSHHHQHSKDVAMPTFSTNVVWRCWWTGCRCSTEPNLRWTRPLPPRCDATEFLVYVVQIGCTPREGASVSRTFMSAGPNTTRGSRSGGCRQVVPKKKVCTFSETLPGQKFVTNQVISGPVPSTRG